MSSAASNIGPVPKDTPFLSGIPNTVAYPWLIFLEKLRSRRIAASSGAGALLDQVSLTADTTVTGPGAPSADGDLLIVAVTHDGLGAWVLTWGGDFAAGSPSNVADKANAVTVFPFVGIGGTWWPFSNAIFLEP